MARAIGDFLRAAGLSVAGELAQTPRRVAEVWSDELLDGYRADLRAVLGELHPSPQAGLVCVTGIEFQSACPHHLLPYRGVCHLAYLPQGGARAGVAGFSRLAALVDALAHRLVLQETLAQDIARALHEGTDALGAGCILNAEQACLTCRDGRKARARTQTSAFVGALSDRSELRLELLQAIASGASSAERGP
jgi:GTP cyclohydrolase I